MEDKNKLNDEIFDLEESDAVIEKPQDDPISDKIFKYDFSVSQQDFFDFNITTIGSATKKSDRKNFIMGIVELIIGVLLIVMFCVTERLHTPIYLVLGILLVLFSSVSLIFYPIFYPKSLKKAINKAYDKSGYKDVQISLEIDSIKITETTTDGTSEFFWAKSNGILETDNHYLLQLTDKRGMLLPKAVTGAETSELDAFFSEVCTHFDLTRNKV